MNNARTDAGTLEYRRMMPYDLLPEELRRDVLEADVMWTWVAVRSGEIVAALFCGPYQGTLFIGSLRALPQAGALWARGLFRAAAQDSLERGVSGFLTILDDSAQGRVLQKIVSSATIQEVAFQGKVVVGRIERFA